VPTVTPAASLPVAEPGLHEDSMTFGGLERTWRVYVPQSLPAGMAAPLVIGLHGGTGSAAQFENTTRMDAQAEAGRFIAVYPDGTGVAQTWNGGACCGYAVRNEVDDVSFIGALLDRLTADYPIDWTRVYATGHSNGAILSLRLGCELSDRIAAVGAVAGSLEVPGCAPSQPVAVLLIHGDADESHPIGGGTGPDSIAGVPFNSAANTMETMRTAMGCSAETAESVDGAITTTNWTGCPHGIAVELQVIAGASHSWPGGKPTLVGGQPSQALDATAAVWQFMSQYAIAP
jgi:polyhydroxybutyrate depolymerase